MLQLVRQLFVEWVFGDRMNDSIPKAVLNDLGGVSVHLVGDVRRQHFIQHIDVVLDLVCLFLDQVFKLNGHFQSFELVRNYRKEPNAQKLDYIVESSL